MRNTFRKPEHLCSQKSIDQLFADATGSMRVFPFQMVYRQTSRRATEPAVKVLISVAKKRFHHAVDRNRVKRLVREAYRKNKHALCAAMKENESLDLAFVWIGNKILEQAVVEQKMVEALARLKEACVGRISEAAPIETPKP